jgi:hypothetical protein
MSELQNLFDQAVGLFKETLDLEVGETAAVSPADLEALSEDAQEGLPEALKEAFSPESLVGDADVPAWADAREQLSAGLRRFVAGKRMAMALVGARGSGREALFDWLESQVMGLAGEHDLRVGRLRTRPSLPELRGLVADLARTLGLGEVEDLKALQGALLEGPRRVVLVERAHNLYSRTIGGFDLLRGLQALISATAEHVLWVLEVDAFAWRYLEELLQVSGPFDVVAEVRPLSAEDLRGAFERQMASLEGHSFQLLPLRGLAPEARSRWREEGYWTRLIEASAGNPSAASLLFTRDVRFSEQLNMAWVLPPRLHPYGQVLAALSRTALLALAIVLEQHRLTAERLGELMLLSRSEGQALLDGFARYHIVTARPPGNRYAVNPAWIGPIEAHLRDWNIL